jgi:hypothetical protein
MQRSAGPASGVLASGSVTMSQADLVTVATFPDVSQADLARERLELEGIRAFVLDEQAGGVMPFMVNSSGGIRLQVAPEDAEKAREVLGS